MQVIRTNSIKSLDFTNLQLQTNEQLTVLETEKCIFPESRTVSYQFVLLVYTSGSFVQFS